MVLKSSVKFVRSYSFDVVAVLEGSSCEKFSDTVS